RVKRGWTVRSPGFVDRRFPKSVPLSSSRASSIVASPPRVLHLKRDGQETPVLKSRGCRTGDPDVPWLRIQRAHPTGEPSFTHKAQPAGVVPQVPCEAPDRL